METKPKAGVARAATAGAERELETLAAEINAEHSVATTAMNTALDHALRAGELLRKSKKAVKHGQWSKWLADNFEGSQRSAQVYIRLAYHREDIEREKELREKRRALRI